MSLDHPGLWGTLTLVLTAFVALFDFQNLLSWRKKFVLEPLPAPSGDFTIIIPLYGSPKYFERRDRLEHLKGHVVVAIEVSLPAMRAFAEHLEGEGWRVFRALVREPNPPKMLRAVLEADAIHTTYVVRLDADTVIGDDLPNAVAAAQADGADLCSVKVLVHNRTETVCARSQPNVFEMGSRKTVKVSLAPRASAISRKQSPSVTKARRGVAWSGSGFEGSLSMGRQVPCFAVKPARPQHS